MLELQADGHLLRFPAVWLRDNCPCADCLDPVSGQKLKDITELPDGLAVSTAEDAGDTVIVTYAPDGHRSAFSRAWLARHALSDDGPRAGAAPAGSWAGGPRTTARSSGCPQTWAGCPRRAGPATWPSQRTGRGPWTRCCAGVSCCCMTCAAEPGLVLEVAASFGFVRETNYGRLFDVRVEPRPGNLAFTSRRILPHTDNPYRDPAPTVQLLHCLRTADDGGDTGLVDGFAAARELRATDRESFALMAGTPVPFGYRDSGTELRASQPLIELSPRGRIRGIRFNNRSAQPLALPLGQVTAFYAAYSRWAALLARPERQLNLRLAPGDCLIFDNTRILHARTAFSGTGGRHLQGCYADLDGLASTLAVLTRGDDSRGGTRRKDTP